MLNRNKLRLAIEKSGKFESLEEFYIKLNEKKSPSTNKSLIQRFCRKNYYMIDVLLLDKLINIINCDTRDILKDGINDILYGRLK